MKTAFKIYNGNRFVPCYFQLKGVTWWTRIKPIESEMGKSEETTDIELKQSKDETSPNGKGKNKCCILQKIMSI